MRRRPARGTGPGGRARAARRAAVAARCAPALLALAGAARADVTLDGSMGNPGPVPFDGTTWEITDDLGRRSGANLFHSFSLFDVGAGQTASFHLLDPAAPEPSRVIARVTGGQRSLIGGRIQSLHAGADLYLLNPSGFSFGPSAAVEALGSVAFSTADVLRFGTGPAFDARSDDPPALLATDAPSAFGFLSGAPASIDLDLDSASGGFDFPLPAGETLSFVGGDVRIRDASAASGNVPTIRIEGGSVEIAAARAAGIDVPVDVASFDAAGRAAGALGSVELSRNALVDVGAPLGAGVGSGRVVVRAGQLVVDDAGITAVNGSGLDGAPLAADFEVAQDAVLRAGARLTAASADAAAGDLRVTGRSVEVVGAGTRLTATASGAGAAPDVRLAADSLHVGDQALVFVRTTQPAGQTGGRIEVSGGSALVDGAATLLNRSQGEASGGAIAVDVAELRVAGGAALRSESLQAGAGSPIEIEADRVVLDSGGQLRSQASAAGAGGSIGVDAGLLELHGASEIRSQSAAAGAGGAIDVRADDARIDGRSQIVAENTAAGAGGAIGVHVDGDLVVAGRGKILSQAVGAATGVGGDVDVRADGSIAVVGEDSVDADVTQISALTSSSAASARGGRLRVSAPRIELRDAGQLRTTTSGAAPGGVLEVADTGELLVVGNATVAGELAGAGLFARSTGDDLPGAGAGAGGGISVAADEVRVEDGGEISARTLRDGAAGDLVIRAGSLVVRGGPRGVSTLSSRGAAGDGGAIDIEAENVELSAGGIVSASTVGDGDAGDIRVAADRIVLSDAPSGLFSQTTFGADTSGAAGDIRIDVAQRLEVRDGARISVDANRGQGAGDVEIHGGPHALVALRGGEVSARSRGNAEAGNVTIDAGRRFVAGRGASVETQAEGNQSGGRIAIDARGIVYQSGSRIATLVDAGGASSNGDGGDVDAPPTVGQVPRLGVLIDPSIVATANDGNGGNIRVAARDLVASQDGVIDATSQGGGISGIVQVTGPDADLAGQVTPLSTKYFDASKLLSTPCAARRARTGSFVVQTREAAGAPPDAPLGAADLPGGAPETRALGAECGGPG